MTEGAILVFAGPSLPPAVRPAQDGLSWRPPAMAGDGLAALEASPRAVVLIDGVFDRYPAIRHKELLALMAHGVPVFGGASMGALRAAELHAYGMVGVGRIFEAYARERLIGDDEVAVLHGPADMGWAALTVPLVNVRATLVRAVRLGVIGGASARRLRRLAAAIFFQDRTWQVLFEAASGHVAPDELDRFAAWAPGGQVDLKQEDALACLSMALNWRADPPAADEGEAPTVFTTALARQVSAGSRPDLASS